VYTGTVAFVGEFQHCRANGRGRFFHPSGGEAVVGTLKDGDLHGTAKIFLESGAPRQPPAASRFTLNDKPRSIKL
jgi:hypothetical protein